MSAGLLRQRLCGAQLFRQTLRIVSVFDRKHDGLAAANVFDFARYQPEPSRLLRRRFDFDFAGAAASLRQRGQRGLR